MPMNHPVCTTAVIWGCSEGCVLQMTVTSDQVSPQIQKILGVRGSLRSLPRSNILEFLALLSVVQRWTSGGWALQSKSFCFGRRALKWGLGAGNYRIWAAAMTTSSGTPFPARPVSAVQ